MARPEDLTEAPALVERLARVAPAAIAAVAKPGPHCVMSSAIGQDVLRALGVRAEPYVAEVQIANAAWIAWAEENYIGGKPAQLRRGAHLLTNKPDWAGESWPSTNAVSGPAWDGHLALQVPDPRNEQQWWLLDLDLGAFERPKRGILLPEVLLAPLVNGRVCGTFEHESGAESHLLYRPLVAPYRDEYLTARDWMDRGRFSVLVRALVKLVNQDPVDFTARP